MVGSFLQKIKLIAGDKTLRRRVLFTLSILVLFRILAVIPIPGLDASLLQNMLANTDLGQFFGFISVFSGGGLANLSIVMLGVGPYITASIVMQLLTIIFPKLKAMYQEEGELGRQKFTQYTRFLTVPLAFIQAFGFLALLRNQGVIGNLGFYPELINLAIITAGSLLLMWLGELITEHGIGNGVSLLIFAGIVASLPGAVAQAVFTFDPSQIPLYLGFIVASVLIVMAVVIMTEAERPIPITYAKRIRGNKVYGGASTYLPLRLNQAGVIPIIFALSILLFPQMLFRFLSTVNNETVRTIADFLVALFTNQIFYSSFYFVLVFVFTYFYTAVTFDPDHIADNLQKGGAFIPGVRPGQSTSLHIGRILTRLTLVGALFLGAIAVLPLLMQSFTGNATLAIGGTALLIVVSVVIDLIKKLSAQVSVREY